MSAEPNPPSEPLATYVPAMPELRGAGGPPVVEIAASLDDSIVMVRHLAPPRSRPDRTPHMLAAGAFVMLVLAAISFGRGVAVAGRNEAGANAWAAAGKAPGDFREERLPPAWEGLGLSSLLLGLGGAAWALRQLHEARRSSVFRIGGGRGADLQLAGVAPHELVRPAAGGWELVPSPGLTGTIEQDGATAALPEGVGLAPIRLPHGARVRATLAGCTLHVAVVDPPPAASLFAGQPTDRSSLVFAGVSVAAHVGLLALLFAVPPEAKVFLSRELFEELRRAKVDFRPLEERKLEQLPPGGGGPGEEVKDPAGSKAGLGPSGKMGTPTSARPTGRFAILRRADRPALTRLDAQHAAQSAGVVGLFRQRPPLAFAALGGTADFASGLDDRDVYGGLIGDEVADASGGWASGVDGDGPGGGGTGLDSVGLGPNGGPFGTIGKCGGGSRGSAERGAEGPQEGGKAKCDYGPGGGGGDGPGLKRRTAGPPPPPKLGQVTSVGELEASVIRRYVRQHLPEIQHCYERQLVVKPDLAGTIDLSFVISGTGDVLSVGARGLGDPAVEGCVAGVIGAIHFPAPAGSGIVRVTSYPLRFNAPG